MLCLASILLRRPFIAVGKVGCRCGIDWFWGHAGRSHGLFYLAVVISGLLKNVIEKVQFLLEGIWVTNGAGSVVE